MAALNTDRAIDAWAQPALMNFDDLPEVARLFKQSHTSHVIDSGITTEQMVASMDEAGVEKVMLCAWHRPGMWIITNDQIAEIVDRFPDRFAGVAAVNLEKPVDAVRELDRAVTQLGFKALRVIPWLWKLPPNDKLYYPLYVKCIELEIPFCTQVGHTGPLMPSEPGRPVPYLDEVALTFPELKIVGGHIGYPWTDEMIGLAWKHENVFIDTSAHLPRYYPQQLIHFLKTYGKQKVLFGTNFPQLPFEKCMDPVRALELPDEVRSSFLRDNARRVFKLD
ncbi:MAG: amidohydrolase family protein [Blastocatellia bacterium]